ncbi:MAG: signal recognition particle-docking protein FtsY [DPANN group archaeon]|nr:signal recognition particle-docking protein FtsY [DPANN group archaeon]
MFGFLKKKLSSVIEDITKKIDDTKETITKTVSEKEITEDALDDILFNLEMILLENNVAIEVSEKICSNIKDNLKGQSVKRTKIKDIIETTFKDSVREILNQEKLDIYSIIDKNKIEKKPTLIMVLGFNGAGKTTNLAKLAHKLLNQGYSCVFAAGDTFRAAAIQQLEYHANTLNIKIIKQDYGADAAAIIFDAVKYAKSKNIDVVLADTAGRTHQDINLLKELEKITRVNNPDIKFLVTEALAGNDVIRQAEIFNKVGIDGVILSKWDIDQKGGAALSITHTIKKPITFLGTGQEYEDLEEFDLDKIIDNII